MNFKVRRISIKQLGLSLFIAMAFEGMAQPKNIKLAEEVKGVYPPLEPSIAINHKNEKNMVAGVVLDRAIYTMDGGTTWAETKLESPYGVYGDPALISDSNGDFYYFHLSNPGDGGSGEWPDRIVCQKSTDGGKTWSSGSFTGLNPPKNQDKAWPAIDPKHDEICVTWTQFDKYGLKDPNCQSTILFSKSTSGGKKWSQPVQLSQTHGDCIDDDNTAEGAVPAVGADGKIFVAWSNQGIIYMDRSYDEGKTWLKNDMALVKQVGGWAMDIPGINRCNGMPVLMIDNSKSRFRGSLYLVWADQINGEDDTDIWFMRSVNHGDNWTQPERINQDSVRRHQFFPWMAIDQATGNMYIVYYDRRAYDDLRTDVYVAYSSDGGTNFNEVKVSESPFVPTKEKFFGDYNNIAAHNGIIAPIWTRMDEGKTSVWTAIIKQDELIKK